MKFRRLLSLAAVAAALLIGSESRAATITLPNTVAGLVTALPNATFVVGDKTFVFGLVNPSGTANPSLINIGALSPTGVAQGSAVPPFGFELSGAGLSASGANAAGDLLLNFSVTAAGGPKILSVNLFGNGAVGSSGSAVISEKVYSDSGFTNLIGQGQVSAGSPSTLITLSNTTLSTVFISKDIAFTAGANAGSFANFSDIQQTFNQTVPEPTSVVMLGGGLLGVLGLSLRRMKKKA